MAISPLSNLFLSWSGDYSREVATFMRIWLRDVVPVARPWMSSEDISKGSLWPVEINARLVDCRGAVIFLTQENVQASWLLFESGALFKGMQDRPICTFLCDLEPPLLGPLAQFQATTPGHDDVFRLVASLQGSLDETPDPRLEARFEKYWPDLEKELAKIARNRVAFGRPLKRATTHDLFEEILAANRTTLRQLHSIELRLNKTLPQTEQDRTIERDWHTHLGPGIHRQGRFTDNAYFKLLGFLQVFESEIRSAVMHLKGNHGRFENIDMRPGEHRRRQRFGDVEFVYHVDPHPMGRHTIVVDDINKMGFESQRAPDEPSESTGSAA